MAILRKPFQGVKNILRFNWHFYLLALAAIVLLVIANFLLPNPFTWMVLTLGIVIGVVTLVSLSVSCYIYDFSGLYKFKWMDNIKVKKGSSILNIHAGFDETSEILHQRFPQCELTVLDFYNPKKHTEVSIKRARKAYPPYHGTQHIATNTLPFKEQRIALIFLIFAAHEIRDTKERTLFFRELRRIIDDDGKVIVTEHLRDIPNFTAYTIGFLHFYTRASWKIIFETTGFKITSEVKSTPFITTFILEPDGTSP